MIQIPNYNDIVKKNYLLFEDFETKDCSGGILKWSKGTTFKITSIKGDEVECKIVSGLNECDGMIIECAKRLVVCAKESMDNCQHAIDLWVNSPGNFVPDPNSIWNNRHGNGIVDYIRTDGEKCKYSYLATLGQFKDVNFFKRVFEENKVQFEKWNKLTREDKVYLHGIIKKKRKLKVSSLNRAKFDKA